jgi:ABC-2 type transport system permease protein
VQLRRVLLIARRDYLATVRTKAFLVGLVVAPLLFGGGLLGIALLKAKPDLADRRVVLVDRSGVAAAAIIQAAGEKSAAEAVDKVTGRQVEPRYLFEAVTADDRDSNAQRLALSERVRTGQLYAFIEIGPRALAAPNDSKDSAGTTASRVACYSNASGIDDAQRWFDGPITRAIQKVRMAEFGVDPSHFNDLLSPVTVERLSLVSRDEKTGAIRKAHKKSGLEGFAVPVGLMMLLGMIVLVGSSPMMPAVTEDKAQRIVEMLLGLATPFELMTGKVLAAVGISLTSSAFYVIGGTLALQGMGMIGMVPFALLPWFYIYLVSDVVMLCAFAAALGSACDSPRDAQSLAIVLVAPVVIPYFLLMPVMLQPNGTIATVMSLIPPFAPMMMLLRQAMPGGVPAWQPWVALAGIVAWTLMAVWAAARIFRVGILMQGKPPKIGEMVRWAIRG